MNINNQFFIAINPKTKVCLYLLLVGATSNLPFAVYADVTGKNYQISKQMEQVVSEDNRSMEVESGFLSVAENRKKINSGNTISIAYQRLRTESAYPKTAVFLLAGGPGASWLNTLRLKERFSEVLFYNQFFDVVLFDQRGAGRSVPQLSCDDSRQIPLSEPFTQQSVGSAIKAVAIKCRDFWLDKGVDLASYNTVESAGDINDLRLALGYEKIILIGGSYGSHLGLHFISEYPEVVSRAIFHGLEGPDHTWDKPSDVLNTLKRIATETEQSDFYQTQIPKQGLLWALQTVIKKVEKNNPKVALKVNGKNTEVVVNKFVIQALASLKAGKRHAVLKWPDLIIAMYKGDFSMPAQLSLAMRKVSAPNAMSISMDFASGISEKRYQEITHDPAQNILGDINFSYTVQQGVWPVKNLGDDFRKNKTLNHQILLIHGTWDMSTPIENAIEMHEVLSNSHLIKVNQAGHNALYDLFQHWPPLSGHLEGFLLGHKTNIPNEVNLPAIDWPEAVSMEQIQLWNASISGNIQAAISALKSGAEVNSLDTRKSKSGRRPLNYAALAGHINMIEWLLANGAEINAQNKTGFTALQHAVENCEVEAFKILLKNKADSAMTTLNKLSLTEIAKQNKCNKVIGWMNELSK